VHASIVTAGIVATQRAAQSVLEPTTVQVIHYVEPAARPVHSIPSRPPIGGLPNTFSVPLPTLPPLPSTMFDPSLVTPTNPEIGVGLPIGTVPTVPTNGVFTSQAVDRIVAALRTNPQPAYPPSLRAANVEGDVLVRFVVDTAGRVERNSIVVLRTTHELFAEAVRAWLPQTRYQPAQAAGLPVRQLVEQRVGFALRK
jgi:TonB family protein